MRIKLCMYTRIYKGTSSFGAPGSTEKWHTVDVSATLSSIFDSRTLLRDWVCSCYVSVMNFSKKGDHLDFLLSLTWRDWRSGNQHHDVLTKMNRLEGQNLDTIRPVLASGAVFVFIFTFQFYRYCKFPSLITCDSCSSQRALVGAELWFNKLIFVLLFFFLARKI